VGDGVYELLVRGHVVCGGHAQKADQMHRATVHWVSAAAQAQFARHLEQNGILTEEESRQLLRGRNAKPKTLPRHASAADYGWATGLEALFCWLYLSGQRERLLQLWEQILALREEA
jgi:ribonuclease-3 family protein